ncbi:MAG TPA: DUF2752 domain-containing protein [Jatrophihabitans sp.]|jgi:hypothetical protein|nr:DUF2752 domain-containing protein [Jatrophihabitans sp.]
MTTARAAGRQVPVEAAALAGAALALDVAFDPIHRHVPLCPLHAFTGLWCPLCGGLRAADSLVHGQLGAALHYNVLFVAALPLVLVWWLDWLRTGRARQPRSVVHALVVIAVAFAVLRNLPFAMSLRGG